MEPFALIHTLFYFLLALTILVAIHEFGHYYAARKLGVKVLKFSIGLGKSVWRYQQSPESTEFSIGMLPLGGFVKMVDEREGEVAERDLPFAFNRQKVSVRSAIVFAGPFANFLLAILLYWIVFMVGVAGIKPIVGTLSPGTLAEQAGFQEGDEIIAVGNIPTPTWTMAISEIFFHAMDNESVPVEVLTAREQKLIRDLIIPQELLEKPQLLHDRLGINALEPSLEPVLEEVMPNSAARLAGLAAGDRLLVADGNPIKDWQQWVDYVRANPDKDIALVVERNGAEINLTIRPAKVETPQGVVGKIGAAVQRPKFPLAAYPALVAAFYKTWESSVMTLKMIGRIIVGNASVDNLSGPISIAKYAEQSAKSGLTSFLEYLAIVSLSLGVVNLLPIPVLDGGHLMFYVLEAVMGKPIPEGIQIKLLNIGVMILLCLMVFSFYIDIFRHPA